MNNIVVKVGDIHQEADAKDMLTMLNLYMQDPMGGEQTLEESLAETIVNGLKKQSNYVFFLAYCGGELAGVANCFVNYSTFKGKQLINIHDFAVNPAFRRKGIGQAMMDGVVEYAKNNNLCKINLEVRHDNLGAQLLYKKMGFVECNPPMYFWERLI